MSNDEKLEIIKREFALSILYDTLPHEIQFFREVISDQSVMVFKDKTPSAICVQVTFCGNKYYNLYGLCISCAEDADEMVFSILNQMMHIKEKSYYVWYAPLNSIYKRIEAVFAASQAAELSHELQLMEIKTENIRKTLGDKKITIDRMVHQESPLGYIRVSTTGGFELVHY